MSFAFKPLWYLAAAFVVAVALGLSQVIYNLYLHPLRSYPGPWTARASIGWFLYYTIKGDYAHMVHDMHLKYGPIVRIAPNELAFTDVRAWKDIYGHRVGTPENIKDPSQPIENDEAHPSIVFAGREQHTKLRRLLSNAFSDKAMREQEPLLQSYVRLLLDQLRKRADQPVDLVKWYNFTTFDVIGHLAFAESFDCLSSSNYHPWVEMIFSSFRFATFVRALNRVKLGLSHALMGLIPRRVLREHKATNDLALMKLLNRKERRPEYTDFMTHLIAAEEKGQLNPKDLNSNSLVFVVAGSETTATLLSGATYYLVTNPRVYSSLVEEIRSAFNNDSEITLAGVNSLEYLSAVLDEALRLYPPGANNHPRLTPPQGATICGQFIPGGTLVGINQYAAFRSPLNFHRPDEFIPERALPSGNPEFSNDERGALQPFSFGPRNCIGRNLAYVEMRLIMCHLLINFDLELMEQSKDWIHQKIFTSWDKKALMVKMHPIKTSVSSL